MPRLRFPLVGSYTSRNINPNSFATKDQQFINCIPEIVKNQLTGKAKAFLHKRPGYEKGPALTGVASAGTVGAIGASRSLGLAAGFINTGGASTSVWDLATSSKVGGDIANTSDVLALTETTISGTDYLVGNFLDTGVIEQWYFPAAGAWTQVTDSDFPTIVGAPAHMDGFVFNMTSTGRIYNSDLNSVSSYNPTNFITADLSPDGGVTVARHNNIIIGFGHRSTEFFENKGHATGSPLSRVGGFRLGAAVYGVSNHPTVLNAYDTVYWIATSHDAAVLGLYRFNGMSPEKISSGHVDRLLASGALNGIIGTLSLHGLNHVCLQGSAGVFCYCIETGIWWELVLASGEPVAMTAASVATPSAATSYFIGSNNARSNEIPPSSPVYQDDGAAYTMTVQTDNIDADTDRVKFWKKLRVIADRQSSGAVGVAWADDDFTSYTTATNVDITSDQSWLTRLGSSRRRSWKFTHSANTPCRIEAVEIYYELGSS